MPEGPSLVFLKEQLKSFTGKKVSSAGGYTKMKTDWIAGKKLLEVNTWGKHLLLRFTNGTVRIHLMLFGSLLINNRKKVNASFFLHFGSEELNFYVVQAQKLTGDLNKIYDWRTDIMNPKWRALHVKKIMKQYEKEMIGDLLLNQTVFTGVGNIIRNEVLFRTKLHPKSITGNIPDRVVTILLKQVRAYGKEFLKEKKNGTLSANWQAYEQTLCPRDNIKFKKLMIGKTRRKTYFCSRCQLLFQ